MILPLVRDGAAAAAAGEVSAPVAARAAVAPRAIRSPCLRVRVRGSWVVGSGGTGGMARPPRLRWMPVVGRGTRRNGPSGYRL